VTIHAQRPGDHARSLKDEVVAELKAWASELGDIEHEIEKTPWGTDEEASGYADHAATVPDLADKLCENAIVAPLREGALDEPILTQEPAENPPPAYRFEAFYIPRGRRGR
jgi:hypothetical protein